MKLLRSFPILAFSLVLLSITALCVAMNSIGLMLVAITVAAISWYMTEGPRGRVLPRWVSNILVIAFTLWVLLELFQNQHQLLKSLGFYAVMLTLVKLYERRTARDYGHLLTLSLVLMMTACLQNSGLLVGVMLVLYAAMGLYALLLFQLYGSFEKAREDRTAATPSDYRLIPPLKPVMGRQPNWRFRGQAVGIATTGVFVSLLIFVGFPREIGADMLSLPHAIPSQRRTGFSWNVDLNAGGRISESRIMVLSLQLFDNEGAPVRSVQPVLLRGAVLDRYQSTGRWVGSAQPRMTDGTTQPIILGDAAKPGPNTITQRITLNQPADGVTPLFAMYAPISVTMNGGGRAGILYDAFTQTIRTEDTARRLLSYTVQSDSMLSDGAAASLANTTRSTVRPRWFLQDLHTLRRIADDVILAANLPNAPPASLQERWQWNRAVAAALTDWLQSGQFTYTLDLSTVVYPNAEVDPVVRFLTTTKRGHCEFFASGLAALCHSKGIPARLVAGYVAYDYDETLKQYNVLERNAHAWVEVAAGDGGGRLWATFDPTPPSTLAALHDNAAATFADQMRWMYQRLEGNWSSSVVNFNGNAQSQLAESFNQSWSGQIARSLESIKDWMQRVNQAFYFGPAGYIWMGIVAFALCIAVVALVKMMRRSMAIRQTLQLQHIRGAEYQRMLRHLGFYLDMLEVLRRAGLGKPHWQPPMQFAAQLQSGSPTSTIPDRVRCLTELFYEARYGRRRLAAQEVHDAHKLVNELAATLNVKPA